MKLQTAKSSLCHIWFRETFVKLNIKQEQVKMIVSSSSCRERYLFRGERVARGREFYLLTTAGRKTCWGQMLTDTKRMSLRNSRQEAAIIKA